MEVVTYNYSKTTSLVNQIGWFFEDSLEMVGVIFLIYSISRWLNKNKVNLINIKKWLVYLIFAIGFLDLSITFYCKINCKSIVFNLVVRN